MIATAKRSTSLGILRSVHAASTQPHHTPRLENMHIETQIWTFSLSRSPPPLPLSSTPNQPSPRELRGSTGKTRTSQSEKIDIRYQRDRWAKERKKDENSHFLYNIFVLVTFSHLVTCLLTYLHTYAHPHFHISWTYFHNHTSRISFSKLFSFFRFSLLSSLLPSFFPFFKTLSLSHTHTHLPTHFSSLSQIFLYLSLSLFFNQSRER